VDAVAGDDDVRIESHGCVASLVLVVGLASTRSPRTVAR